MHLIQREKQKHASFNDFAKVSAVYVNSFLIEIRKEERPGRASLLAVILTVGL
jgi:hypothetical protein